MKQFYQEKSFIKLDDKLVAVTYLDDAGFWIALYDPRTKKLNWFLNSQFNILDMYRRGCLYEIPVDIPINLPPYNRV